MKIRNGFVSNSSSSSFILMFKDEPNKFNIMKLLFNEDGDNFIYDDDNIYSKQQICDSVLSNIDKTEYDNIIELIKSEVGSFNEYNIREWERFITPEYKLDYLEIKDKLNYYEKEYSNLNNILYKKRKEIGEEKWSLEWRSILDNKREKMSVYSDKMYTLIENIIKDNYKDYKFSSIEYSDNDGEFYSFMEHSGVLDKISIVKISHH